MNLPSRRGARRHGHRMGIDSRSRAWRRHHAQMAVDSARRLRERPLASLMTMLAIAVALMLPAILWLLLSSASLLDRNLDDSAQMTLYLAPQLTESQAMDISDQVGSMDGVISTRLITAAAGLQEFQQRLGSGDILSLLDDNPLPATIVVQPNSRDPQQVQALADRLSQLRGVDSARLDMAWLERLRQLAELGQRLVIALGVLFACGVLLVVGNTVRLAVESRRREIEVVTLVGATHAFVRRPFLYSGAWYGLGGGFMALVLLLIGRHWLSAPINALAQSFGTHYTLPALGFGGSMFLLSCGTLLGLIGAWLAVDRHLAGIRPR
ncbi:permease-like cell division protein FtsX [Kushneria phosphatilytica]|uniref:Cell division protein FtsX n=1 Tax=Kushneria phosphatilytica TaxID=657387 RepID=A0A1S1NVV2_9GAMM|nr:permease-like cell division protein FtsX [Kushneria phosphatilytica]OHV10903.1 cell division protein FtsX [Kushneria phosphatilytica]QEL12011.1 FtsX-like permease family protein [Kushneria phosphatilytica]